MQGLSSCIGDKHLSRLPQQRYNNLFVKENPIKIGYFSTKNERMPAASARGILAREVCEAQILKVPLRVECATNFTVEFLG
jgi:hypothetical protein